MRWPVFAAIVPELVPRPQLPFALALNGVSMNISRIVGPLVAGAIIAAAGSAWVFALNAGLSTTAGLVVMRWRRVHKESPFGRERLGSAMRVGMQYVWQYAAHARRAGAHRTVLLPLHGAARAVAAGGAGTARRLGGHASPCCSPAWAAGAIIAALMVVRIRRLLPIEQLVLAGTVLQALAMLTVAFAPNIYVAAPAMFVAGSAWITVANSLTVTGPDDIARLGARSRHVDLPDGDDGLRCGRRRPVGPGGDLDHHPHRAGDRRR